MFNNVFLDKYSRSNFNINLCWESLRYKQFLMGGGNVEYNITLQTVLNYLGVARISSVMYKIAGKDVNEKSEVTPG